MEAAFAALNRKYKSDLQAGLADPLPHSLTISACTSGNASVHLRKDEVQAEVFGGDVWRS